MKSPQLIWKISHSFKISVRRFCHNRDFKRDLNVFKRINGLRFMLCLHQQLIFTVRFLSFTAIFCQFLNFFPCMHRILSISMKDDSASYLNSSQKVLSIIYLNRTISCWQSRQGCDLLIPLFDCILFYYIIFLNSILFLRISKRTILWAFITETLTVNKLKKQLKIEDCMLIIYYDWYSEKICWKIPNDNYLLLNSSHSLPLFDCSLNFSSLQLVLRDIL